MTDLRTARDYVRQRLGADDPAHRIILDLVREHGAAFREAHRLFELRCAGVTAQSEAGPISTLRAWLALANGALRLAA